MKLWQKVSVISAAVLLMVVMVCGALLTAHSRQSIIDITVKQAEYEQNNLNVFFSEMVNYYIEETDSPIVKQSMIKYCFSVFANETSVLKYGGETVYSRVSIDPQPILQIDDQKVKNSVLTKIDGRNILIAGSYSSFSKEEYSVYIVKDITSVYDGINTMIFRFAIICLCGIAAGTLLIMLLMRRAVRPLVKLKETARKIAVGEYFERANTDTKDEIGELARDFNTMASAVQSHIETLEDTAKRQKFFIGGLTHEFKTPMTSMLIHTDTLLNTSLTEDEAKNSLLHIHAQCRWLESLTQKMLKLITLGEDIKIREESVSELIDEVIQSVFEVLKERQTPLITKCDAETLFFEPDLMKTLLINLVDNASKASEQGQEIILWAHDNIIEVTDCGQGIKKEDIAHVTDPFYMADGSRSKSKGGSGLGLALVKQIAEAHGAKLVIESEIEKGTTVKILFPC